MNLIIKIENPKEDRNTPDDIQMLKEILKRSGVTMRAEDSFGSKSVYRLRGREEKIWEKLTRGAGARSTTKNIPIKKILEIEEKYKRMPKEKEAALAACGVQLRNYQEIKKNICDCYGDLQKAMQCGHIYFVRVRKTK